MKRDLTRKQMMKRKAMAQPVHKIRKPSTWYLTALLSLLLGLLLSACSTEVLETEPGLRTQKLCDDFGDCILIPIDKPWLDPGPYSKVKVTVIDEVARFVASLAVEKEVAQAVALSLVNEAGEVVSKAALKEGERGAMSLRLEARQLAPGSYDLQIYSKAKHTLSSALEIKFDAEQAPLLLWSYDKAHDAVLADVAAEMDLTTVVVSYSPEEMAIALDKVASQPDLILSPWSLGACDNMDCPREASLNTLEWCKYCGDFVAINPNPFIPIYKHDKFIAVKPFAAAKSIPVAWDVFSMFADPAWFKEQELTIPTNAAEVLTLVKTNPAAVAVGEWDSSEESFLEKFFRDWFRQPPPHWLTFFEHYLSLEPDPEPWRAGLILDDLSSLVEGPDPTPWIEGLFLKDLNAIAKITQAIINMDSHQVEQAVEFADALRSVSAQQAIFAASGHLPVHRDVLNTLAEEGMDGLIQYCLNALPH